MEINWIKMTPETKKELKDETQYIITYNGTYVGTGFYYKDIEVFANVDFDYDVPIGHVDAYVLAEPYNPNS